MFLELHLLETDEKIMLNINHIDSIYQRNEKTNIYVGNILYRVRESYDEIVEHINKYCNI